MNSSNKAKQKQKKKKKKRSKKEVTKLDEISAEKESVTQQILYNETDKKQNVVEEPVTVVNLPEKVEEKPITKSEENVMETVRKEPDKKRQKQTGKGKKKSSFPVVKSSPKQEKNEKLGKSECPEVKKLSEDAAQEDKLGKEKKVEKAEKKEQIKVAVSKVAEAAPEVSEKTEILTKKTTDNNKDNLDFLKEIPPKSSKPISKCPEREGLMGRSISEPSIKKNNKNKKRKPPLVSKNLYKEKTLREKKSKSILSPSIQIVKMSKPSASFESNEINQASSIGDSLGEDRSSKSSSDSYGESEETHKSNETRTSQETEDIDRSAVVPIEIPPPVSCLPPHPTQSSHQYTSSVKRSHSSHQFGFKQQNNYHHHHNHHHQNNNYHHNHNHQNRHYKSNSLPTTPVSHNGNNGTSHTRQNHNNSHGSYGGRSNKRRKSRKNRKPYNKSNSFNHPRRDFEQQERPLYNHPHLNQRPSFIQPYLTNQHLTNQQHQQVHTVPAMSASFMPQLLYPASQNLGEMDQTNVLHPLQVKPDQLVQMQGQEVPMVQAPCFNVNQNIAQPVMFSTDGLQQHHQMQFQHHQMPLGMLHHQQQSPVPPQVFLTQLPMSPQLINPNQVQFLYPNYVSTDIQT